MSKFSDMLSYLRKREGLSQKELAEKLGISRSAIGMYERGDREPNFELLEAIADLFNVNMNTLMGTSTPPNTIPYQEFHVAPIVGTIPAGYPALAFDHVEGYASIPYSDTENYFFLRVSGESMINAGINNGDLVLIRKQPCAEDGQIVAARVNGDEATLKRYKTQGETILLLPENPDYDPILVRAKDFQDGYASIIGVALEVRHTL